jgi:pyrroloquinoline quinone biosynthesis protein D
VAVLQLIDGARDLGGIVDALAQQFDAPRAEIAADVAALLDDLTARGAVAW